MDSSHGWCLHRPQQLFHLGLIEKNPFYLKYNPPLSSFSRFSFVSKFYSSTPKTYNVIDQVLDFIRAQMDGYLRMKLDPLSSSAFIQLANVAWNDSETVAGTINDKSDAFISLVNIEEDRISKSQDNVSRNNNILTYKNPKIYLNLYILFSVNLSSYTESLKRLSYIIQFFQYRNVFTPLATPSLPAGVEQLIFDLYTLSFQDLNNLWGIMGSKYLPSVIYKMRLISISEEFELGDAGVINEIVISGKNLQS